MGRFELSDTCRDIAVADFAIACLSGVSLELDFESDSGIGFDLVNSDEGLLSGLLLSSDRLDRNTEDRFSWEVVGVFWNCGELLPPHKSTRSCTDPVRALCPGRGVSMSFGAFLSDATASSGPSSEDEVILASSKSALGDTGLQFSVSPVPVMLAFFLSPVSDFLISSDFGRTEGTGFRFTGDVARTAFCPRLSGTGLCETDIRFSGDARRTAVGSPSVMSSAPVSQSVDCFLGDCETRFVGDGDLVASEPVRCVCLIEMVLRCLRVSTGLLKCSSISRGFVSGRAGNSGVDFPGIDGEAMEGRAGEGIFRNSFMAVPVTCCERTPSGLCPTDNVLCVLKDGLRAPVTLAG